MEGQTSAFDRRKLAPAGLWIALAAGLAAAGLYIVQREWNLPLQISLALMILGLAFFIMMDPARARRALTGRQARYGSNVLVLGIAILGILVVVNWLAYENPKRWDLTEDQNYTLAPETVETLKSLPGQVQVEAYYSPNLDSEQTDQLLDQYRFYSDGKLEYKLIDPIQDPVRAGAAGITKDGTVVLRMGEATQIVSNVTEQELTGALVRLINPEVRAVYFLTGHGERSLDQGGNENYAMAKRTLESKNYTVQELNLLAEKQIPTDARAIVIAGPNQPLTAEENSSLQAYLGQGGALVVLSEPDLSGVAPATDPLSDTLASDWSIRLGQDVVVDLSSSQASLLAIGAQYGTHAIVEGLNGTATLFFTARSLEVGTSSSGSVPGVLVSTIPRAWAEKDLASLAQAQQAGYDEGVDLPGPITLAAAVENTGGAGRVVVFGDADFASDGYFSQYGNEDLFINAVDWAAGAEELINLTPKEATTRLLVQPQQTTLNLILLGSVIVLPGLALIAGLLVWIQRRRRG